MCGIAGIYAYRDEAPPVDREELLRIRERMRNRGPDGAGLWISEGRIIGLAHRRLSIIDLTEAGAQPMHDADTDNQIVFNGEIYNYPALRRELEAAGQRFRSYSDTEVLLKLYARHGAAMVHKLRGMYAFAIWDARQQGLFLARDPFGIKPLPRNRSGGALGAPLPLDGGGGAGGEGGAPVPGKKQAAARCGGLYLTNNGKTLRFASQVKALLASGAVDTRPEPAGHAGFFLWGHVPEPCTLYKGIRAFPAGTRLWIDRSGRKEETRFFDLTQEFTRRPAALDRPLDPAEVQEAPFAETLARHYGAQHRTQWEQRQDFAYQLDALFDAMDLSSIDGVNSYFVCRAFREAGRKVGRRDSGIALAVDSRCRFGQAVLVKTSTRAFQVPVRRKRGRAAPVTGAYRHSS